MRRSINSVLIIFAVCGIMLLSAFGCSDNPEADSLPPSMQAGSNPGERPVPNVVPYLDSVPSDIDGQGTAVATPSTPLPIGTPTDFEITFMVGEAGVDADGFVMLQISPWWGWSQPQTHYPGAPGFTRVEIPSGAPFDVYVLPLKRVVVAPGKDGFAAGEKIVFRYFGRVDKFAESEELLQIFVDADGDGHSACIMAPPIVRTLARAPVRLVVSSPSQIKPGDEIEVSAAAVDALGNWAELPSGTYTLKPTRGDEPSRESASESPDKSPDKPSREPSGKTTEKPNDESGDKSADNSPVKPSPDTAEETTDSPPINSSAESADDSMSEQKLEFAGGEKTISFKYTVADAGIYFFNMEGPSGLAGRSNVTLCQKGVPRRNLYFGDIHGHTRISDGTGTPEDYYRFAREVSRLDIAALTDHADYGNIPVKGAVWERIKKAANDAYKPGRFTTFLGFEWTNWVSGHRDVYYRDGDGPVFRSIDPDSNTPEKIWKILEPFEAMTVAHHVGGGPIATDWNIEPDPAKEWLVEICSIHGSSEYYGGEAMIYRPKQGSFARDALARGYKLGIIASGDTHDGHPGRRTVGAVVNGIVAVYSPELTREAVWEAFKARQVYGTSGPKIILNFRVADSPMGSEVKWTASKGALPIAVRVVACDDIEVIEIIRNGVPVFGTKGNGVFAQFLMQDPEPPTGDSWYYVRVVQKDGNMAWSSPVWVTFE
jgi:hypothetical protein